MSAIGLGISLLNNSLSLELFIRCGRIRRTNCGIYLIIYSILSLLSNIILLAYKTKLCYRDESDIYRAKEIKCYLEDYGYGTLLGLGIWFSALIAFERGLIICCGSKSNATRWRSCLISVFTLLIAGGSVAPLLYYKCDWSNMPNLKIWYNFLNYLYIPLGILTYLLASILVLISFAYRIRRYGTENNSWIKTFLKLLYTHWFVFVPPVVIITCLAPFAILNGMKQNGRLYLRCGISAVEVIIRVFLQVMVAVPFILTWLLFVYPSRVYMTEFYLNTWSGQFLAKILLVCKSRNGREESDHLPAIKITDNERDNRDAFLKPNRTDRRSTEFYIELNRIESY